MAFSGYQFEFAPHRQVWSLLNALTNRYITDNLLPIGLTPGPKSPINLDSFITPFLEELKELQEGVIAYDGHTQSQFLLKAHLVLVTGDTPAISKLFQFAGHGATYPCRACTLQGTPFPYSYKKVTDNVEQTINSVRYYYPRRSDAQPRTAASYEQDGQMSMSDSDNIKNCGVKGISPLVTLPTISIPVCSPFDIMHLVYLGFTRDICRLLNGSYFGGKIRLPNVEMSAQAWKELGSDMEKIQAPVSWGRYYQE